MANTSNDDIIIPSGGNVILIEPNAVNINRTLTDGVPFVNGIPQYQDMYVFAELTARSKGRSVSINGKWTGENPQTINLMGNNQDSSGDNPNFLNFTTNYYDGSTGNRTQYEGFGISNIKIKVSASFVPQISIQFVDVRGLAFFNQKDSPYRILFDFPPPTFTLTIKGYYGKSITYEIHLVKYTSEFSAENGNFVIDAQFVAMTFAPLADILLRYVVNVALINDASSMTPTTGVKPKNTYELILKLKNLYSAIADKLKTDTDNMSYDSAIKDMEYIDIAITALKEYELNEELNKNVPYLVIKGDESDIDSGINPATQSNATSTVVQLVQLSEFDTSIKKESTTGTPVNLKNRLCIVFVIGTNNTPADEDQFVPFDSTTQQPTFPTYIGDMGRIADLQKVLNTYRDTLVNNANPKLGITTNDIPDAGTFFSKMSIGNNTTKATLTTYVSLDITDYYYKLYKKKLVADKKKNELSGVITTKINNMVSQGLGMSPTIYNIFEIILNDVDEFFDVLRTTSKLAEVEHEKDKAIITGNNSDVNGTKIYAFPLIVETSIVQGGAKEERVAPIKYRDLGAKFPELDMVDNFIDTFQTQEGLEQQYNLRSEQNDDGSYKWIPISPLDSTLGGASPLSPYIGINDNALEQIYKILLKRFYILTQSVIYDDFYNTSPSNAVHNAYLELYAESEAVNLASALSAVKNSKISGLVNEQAVKFAQDPQLFYDSITNITDTYENGTINLYNFPTDDPKYFPITPTDTLNGLAYIDKNNPEFEGVFLYPADITLQTPPDTENAEKPVDKFKTNAKSKFFKRVFGASAPESFLYDFTQENVLYIKDIEQVGNTMISNVPTRTRFLTAYSYDLGGSQFPESQKLAYQNGNTAFKGMSNSDEGLLNNASTILPIWIEALSGRYAQFKDNDDAIYDTIINTSSPNYNYNLSAMLILSNFGSTLSPFNIYPSNLNQLLFKTPSALEVPTYLPQYIGALVDAIEGGWVNQILNFFTGSTGTGNYDEGNGLGSIFSNEGYYVLADLHDVQNYLSVIDKSTFRQAYVDFLDKEFTEISYGLNDLYLKVSANTTTYSNDGTGKVVNKGIFDSKTIAYNVYLNPNADIDSTKKGTSFYILKDLATKKNIINFSQITFKMKNTAYEAGYTSLATLNTHKNSEDVLDYKPINDKFFTTLFGKLAIELREQGKKEKEDEEASKKIKGDKDIITQTYYSFKNINDKWLSGPVNGNQTGYPFNSEGKKNLIDMFAFVDRAMNPIGDTIINAEILVQMLEDPNISVFSALSQLLSLNGFEFFPLQNFMSITSETSWIDSFKIHTGAIPATTSTAFVCMYIGGSSSYPSTAQNGFVNDGIIDIANPGVSDFSTKPTANQGTVNDLQIENNPDFPWRQVRAFRVRFGTQNQSMFTGIKIDSKEYPETNESIQILSRLAGDNKANAPTPKGQNLYNLYENRSYKATVTGFGNAMIQPTQYFQLENIPLFNGAYIILDVEHSIEANKMTTTFSGTKLLKYPVPRVLNPAAFTGFNGDMSSSSVGEITKAALISNSLKTKFNSMYILKIE